MSEENKAQILPKVSVVITTVLPKNKKYLDACVASVRGLDYPKDRLEVLVVTPDFSPEPTLSKARNYGISKTDPTSKYVFLLHDDVIVPKDSLLNLVNIAGDNQIILTGISPSQDQFDHCLGYNFVIDGTNYQVDGGKTSMNEELEKKHLPAFGRARSPYPFGMYFVEQIPMFAVLIPRTVLSTVGEFDESLQGISDDVDYSWRARDKGVRMAVLLDTFLWHFGSASAEARTPKQQYEGWSHFRSKYGRLPPYIDEGLVADAKKAAGLP